MPQVDFYLLPYEDMPTSYAYLCRLIEKAYARKHRIYIHTSNRQEAHHIDELLWTFKDNSFIPHNLIGEGPNQPPPVQIGFEDPGNQHRDILINMSTEAPEFHQRFQRILEVIPNNEERLKTHQEHTDYYTNLGYTINQHQIKG